MKVTMFKSRKPKQFSFKTRYYNPDEDERKRRLQKAMRTKDNYDFNADDFKDEMKYRWGLHRESQSDFNKNNTSINRVLLFVLIIAIVGGIFWYLNS